MYHEGKCLKGNLSRANVAREIYSQGSVMGVGRGRMSGWINCHEGNMISTLSITRRGASEPP